MIGFLAYEGFELIANASDRIGNPRRTLPIAFLGSVLFAIVIYTLAFIVGLGHLPLSDLVAAKDFAVSAAAGAFLGPWGFGLMALGAVLASASAINADYFGAARLPPELKNIRQLPSAFIRSLSRRSWGSLFSVGAMALLAVNLVPIEALSAATSGGFLLVFAAVNVAAVRLAPETGARRIIPAIAALLCVAALAITLWQFLSEPATVMQAAAIGGIVLAAIAIEALAQRLVRKETARAAGAPPSHS
jgi:amino acid transporter